MIHMLTNTYHRVDPWFGRNPAPIELDMGCGKGRFALETATRFPARLVLGCDVMLGRLRRIQKKVETRALSNVELLRTNTLELVAFQLPEACVERAHLLCPDPWPKARHRRRRLITTDFLCRLRRVLVPGGILHVATDHLPYLEALECIMANLAFFEEDVERTSLADVADIKTDFEILWEGQGRTVPHRAYRLVD